MEAAPLSAGRLSIAALLLLVNLSLSFRFRLGLERKILVAVVRCVLQLSAMALVLGQVFEHDAWYLVLPVLVVMALAASQVSVSRVDHRPPWLFAVSFTALSAGCALTTAVAITAVMEVDRWYQPRYIIPLVGMLLGNALTGISLGLRQLFESFERERDQIELWLAFGATSFEAVRDVVQRSLTHGMIPVLNSMAAAGLVSIPGMMTGMLLAGQPVGVAVRYQVMIFFLIGATTALGLTGAVLLSTRRLFDSLHRPSDDLTRHRVKPLNGSGGRRR